MIHCLRINKATAELKRYMKTYSESEKKPEVIDTPSSGKA